MSFSDYIVYIDESGDHSLTSITQQYPVFVLAFCVFEKRTYYETIVPAVQKLKFDFWGHDCIILHSHEIRKAHGNFRILQNAEIRLRFIERINALIGSVPCTLIASVIEKNRHVQRYAYPANPYEIALAFCMERLQRWLEEQRQENRPTHLIVERRGQAEDVALELEFRRIVQSRNYRNLELVFMDKKHNSSGLQFADLVAHPIGRHVINPAQLNRAYDLIAPKFRQGPGGRIAGYGLKIFP